MGTYYTRKFTVFVDGCIWSMCNMCLVFLGGCMHMKCALCCFQWCWICCKEWTRDCQADHWFGWPPNWSTPCFIDHRFCGWLTSWYTSMYTKLADVWHSTWHQLYGYRNSKTPKRWIYKYAVLLRDNNQWYMQICLLWRIRVVNIMMCQKTSSYLQDKCYCFGMLLW